MSSNRPVATALCAAVAALCTLLVASPAAPARDLQSKLEAKQAKLDKARERKDVLTTTIARDGRRIDRLTAEVAGIRAREAAVRAREVDRFSLGAMFAFAGLCVFAGIFPGLIIDLLAPVVMVLTDGARLPVQTTIAWLTIVPLSAGRSSYNGLLVLLFIAFSAGAAFSEST